MIWILEFGFWNLTMFRNKTFNIAFLISVSWHLVCMFCFTIVVLPIKFPMAKVSAISFLGPLLEKTAFELMLDRKAEPKKFLYGEPMRLGNTVLIKGEEILLDKPQFEGDFLARKDEKAGVSAHDLFGTFKIMPPLWPSSIGGAQAKDVLKPLSVVRDNGRLTIEGPLADREILFEPEAPIIVKRVESNQDSFIVELKCAVSPGGKVEEAGLLASSGYPDIDLAAINYLKGFQFSSTRETTKQMRGTVKLNLKVK